MSRRKRFTRNLGRVLRTPLPMRTTVEWVRFEHLREPYGVFCYLKAARQTAPEDIRFEIDSLSNWFEVHLTAPIFLTIERCWFRAEAEVYVAQGRRLAEAVCAAGIPIVERRTCRVPGAIEWEDRHQVAVRTFRDALRPSRARQS